MESNPIRKDSDIRPVLILIIMEDTHGVRKSKQPDHLRLVLILIIMEDTHGVSISNFSLFPTFPVLILIIMEDTHGDFKDINK